MEKILTTNHVSMRFGGFMALKEVEVELNEGEILALIGTNGSGKTTMINVISGFYQPTKGNVFYNGKDITSLPSYLRAREGIVRTFQLTRPFGSLSVLDNTMIGALMKTKEVSQARRKALEVLKELGFTNSDMRTICDKATTPLRKKVELARALCMEPRVLLLDEVMAGLSESETSEVLKLIDRLRDNGVAIMIVEHILKAVMSIADNVVVLNSGEKIAEGTPSEIASNRLVHEVFIGGNVE